MGSAYNRLKIDKPNEVDFTYEMNIQTMLGENVMITDFKSESS